MSKKIGKINFTKEFVQGIKGFEDVFEDYVESEEFKDRERRQSDGQKNGEQHELQHFLEQENARLSGLESFLTRKIPLKLNFSQTDKLLHIQNERKRVLREKLVPECLRLDSPLQKNLAAFFNSHFS